MTNVYDQKKLWTGKWSAGKVKAVNNYARRSFSEIKKHGGIKTLLDLGCGAGQDAVYFTKQGLRVTAADFSEAGIRLVPKNISNLESLCLDIANINLKSSSMNLRAARPRGISG